MYVNVTGAAILFVYVDPSWEFQIRQSQIKERGISYPTLSKNTPDREVQVTCERKWIPDRDIRSSV